MRKCYFCKIGAVKPGFVTVPETTASLTVVLKEVPAKVCNNCGEHYFDSEVVSELEKIISEAENAGIDALVRKYPVKPAAPKPRECQEPTSVAASHTAAQPVPAAGD